MLAVGNMLDGKRYISPGISGELIERYLGGKRLSKSELPLEIITRRERQVLKLIGEGHKNKEIADYLCISVKTVEKHRANLMKKLDLHSASASTDFAIKKGLISK
jgi:DNA-binding NarL/FixJ family response regulator